MMVTTIWTFALDNKRCGGHCESFGECKRRQVHLLQTKRTMTMFAIEVYVLIGMRTDTIAFAEFIVQASSSILEHVHYVMLPKKRKYTKDA